MPMIQRFLSAVCLTSLLGTVAPAWAQSPLADEVRALLEQGNPQAALARSQQAQATGQGLGDPALDFFHGVAALASGEPGDGVLALERYVAQFPDNRNARFHLARGYYMLGDHPRAREEFEALALQASGDEALIVSQYLKALRARESVYRPTTGGFAETGLVFDRNVNSGVDAGALPGLGGLVVAPGASNEREAAWAWANAAGARVSRPLAPGVGLYASGLWRSRWHAGTGNDQFDTGTLGLQVGLSLVQGRHYGRLGLDWQGHRYNAQSYLNASSLMGMWGYQHDAFNRYGLAAQWARLDFDDIRVPASKSPGAASFLTRTGVQDSRLWTLAPSWQRTFEHPWSPMLTLEGAWGQETNQRGRADLSRHLASLRLAGVAQPSPRWMLSASWTLQRSDYQGPYAPGLASRQDRSHTLDLAVNYAVTPRWSVQGEAMWMRQTSTIALHGWARQAVGLKLRYEWE